MSSCHETFAYKFYSIKRRMIAASRQSLQKAGISHDMYIVLRPIYETPGLTQREIGEICGKDANVIVKTIDRLERLGLVTRIRGEKDRRTFTLHITEAGVKLVEDCWDDFVGQQEACLGMLTAKEKAELNRLLDKILEA